MPAAEFEFETTGFLYEHRPDLFVIDLFDWKKLHKDDKPTDYQLQSLMDLAAHGRFALRGPHGLGKTAWSSWVVLWFAITREALGRDWKVPTTAGSWLQLKKYLWPEIHKWARLLRWELIGRPPFVDGRELLDLSLKLAHGEAMAVPSNQPALIEGAHADSMLFLFDESKAIQEAMFDAAEGAFSGAGKDTSREAFACAVSTPGPPAGRFYDIHARKRGFEDWKARHVTVDDAIRAGRISEDWRERRRRQWGETSAQYRNRVLGEFATSATDAVIPMEWLEAANQRWLELRDKGEIVTVDPLAVPPEFIGGRKVEPRRLTAIGVDVAYGGSDKAPIAYREDLVIHGVDRIVVEQTKTPTILIARRVAAVLKAFGGVAVVDVVGIGAGTYDTLRDDEMPAEPFSAGSSAKLPDGTPIMDSSGEIGFADLRAAAWWHLRELLNPNNENDIAIPPDDALSLEDGSLTGDLLAPTWKYAAGNKIRVESKDDIRKRIGRSTDDGDAVVQAFALDLVKDASAIGGAPIVVNASGGSRWRPSW